MPSVVNPPGPPSGVHPKVVAGGIAGAVGTLVLAAVHLVRTGHPGVDEQTLTAAALTVVTFVAGYLRRG